MATKHFFKILVLFTGMILVGLIGVVVVNYFTPEEGQANLLKSIK